MEIFIKDKVLPQYNIFQNASQKVNWFSSIPEKYRNEILAKLKKDRLKIDDPQCSQYQVVLDLMGRNEQQALQDKERILQNASAQAFQQHQDEIQHLKDQQSSAYILKRSINSQDSVKQLLFTLPEYKKPKFLSKNSLLQQLLQQNQFQSYLRLREVEKGEMKESSQNNLQILEQVFQIPKVNEAFEHIKNTYGDEAFQYNLINLQNFIKSGKLNMTYTIKYYGVDEGQIGILSRRVPYEKLMKKKFPRLPKIKSERILSRGKIPKRKKSEEELVQIEVSEDEQYLSDESEPIPIARKPSESDVIQASLEEAAQKKQNNKQEKQEVKVEERPRKKVIKTRRVKKLKYVKKQDIHIPQTEQKASQITQINDTIKTLNTEDLNYVQANSPDMTLEQNKDTQRASPNKQQELSQSHSQNIDLQQIYHEESNKNQPQAPFIINLQELFEQLELENMNNFKKPEPEKYNNHIVHSYSLPKGLQAMKRQQVFSESETYDRERYSKANIQLTMIDKECQKMNLGGQSKGLKGAKVKPIYFPFSFTQVQNTTNSQLFNYQANESQLHSNFLQNEDLNVLGGGKNIKLHPLQESSHPSLRKLEKSQKSINIGETLNAHYTNDTISLNDLGGKRYSLQNVDSAEQSGYQQNPKLDEGSITVNVLPKNKSQVPEQFTSHSVYHQDKNLSASIPLNYTLPHNQTLKNNQIIKNLTKHKKKYEINEFSKINTFKLPNSPNQKNRHPLKSGLPSEEKQRTNIQPTSFCMNNQNKLSYLMDTQKLLKVRDDNSREKSEEGSEKNEDQFMLEQNASKPTIYSGIEQQASSLPAIKSTFNIVISNDSSLPAYENLNHQEKLLMNSSGRPPLNLPDLSHLNPSNLKVICRIRPPKTYEQSREQKKMTSSFINSPSNKTYTCVRNKSRSISKEMSSPYRHSAALRQTLRSSSGKRSNSRSNSRGRSSANKSSSFVAQGNGMVNPEKKYCIFTTKERSNVVLACENPVPGKLINESLVDQQDLKYFNNSVLAQNQSFTFNFDSVYNESIKQEKFYAASVRPIVKSFVEGENGCVLLFGPTEGGKTYTLKGKTGMERGILPRAVEDMFNIVRNSEEREEDFEMVTPDITETESDVIPHQDLYRGSGYHMNQSNPRDNLRKERVPERMFLKVCVYQIYVDKVLDLLSTTNTKQRVQVDHYIDKNSDEVVSRLSNITEKVVFTLEDFYSVLQEAFKNRRIESVSMQEQELRKKSHFIIGLTLMKRQSNKKMSEISHINFVELSGSEQAVAEEKFYKDASVKNFVTKSFNSLSSQLLRAALKKKNHGLDEGDSKVVNSLRNTLTSSSNILLVCCVNPGPQFFEHSLPAVKFCARIRDYVMRKTRNQMNNQRSFNNSTMDQIEYNNETDRGVQGGTADRQITRDLIDHIRNEVTQKSIAMGNGEYLDKQELERWRLDKIDIVERNIQRLRNQSYKNQGTNEKDYQPMIEDLIYIKDRLQNIQQHTNQGFNMTQTQRSQTYNPYISQSHHQASIDLRNPPTNSYDHIYRQDSVDKQRAQHQQSSDRIENFDLARYEHPETPQFDYGTPGSHYDQQLSKSGSRRQLQPVIRNQSNVFSPTSQQNRSSIQSKQAGFNQQSQHQVFQKQNTSIGKNMYDIETSLDAGQMFQGNQSMSRNPGAIRVYNTQEDQSVNPLSPKMPMNDSKNFSKQISRIHQNQTSNHITGENDFLNKVHPQLDVSLTGEPNNIMGSMPPSRSPSPQKIVMFRPANTLRQQQYSRGNMAKGSGNNTSQISQKSHQSIIDLQNRTQRLGSHKQSLLNVSNKISELQNESVYENEYDCMNDINRLIKINDFEGVKKRIMQIYKEKLEQENVLKSIDQDIGNLRDELEKRDQIIKDYQNLVQATADEHQQVVEDFVAETNEKEQKFNLKEVTLQKAINTFKEKVKELQDERDRYEKEHELMSIENKTYDRVKTEAEERLNKVLEENEKLKQNYEILKEHEISLIRDFEGKKQKEMGFQDDQITLLKEQIKEEQNKIKDYESQIFSLKEDFRRAEFDNEKNAQDRRHMAQQIEKLGTQLEKEEESREEMMKTMEDNERAFKQLEQTKVKLEDERAKAFSEIDKLHSLIEEMETTIQREQQKRGEERQAKEDKVQEFEKLSEQVHQLKEQLIQRESEIAQFDEKEQEYMRQVRELAQRNEEMDKQLIMIKAKEYDKVDLLKRVAELESKIKFLQVDNETLVKERNNLDIANVELNREKVEIEQHCLGLENELNFFRNAHEEHLDKFDQKMESISTELSKLKNENIQLKEKEKNLRKAAREIEEERDEWREKNRISERRCQDLGQRMNDMEKEIIVMMQEKEKEMRDNVMRQNMEVKIKEEEKGKMLEDIQHLIKSFKEEKKNQKTHIPAIHSIHHSSGYY